MQAWSQEDDKKEKWYPLDEEVQIYQNPVLEDVRKDSSPTQQYLRLLNLPQILPINKDELISLFHDRHILYEPTGKFQNELQISLQEFSSNFQAIKISVRYGHFSTFLNLINIELQSPIRNLNEGLAGSQGQVYRFCFQDTPVAIKCFKIVQSKFELLLKAVIKEYFLLAIASILKAGPALVKIFGFDLLIFRDEACFSMEYCQMEHFEIDWSVLQRKLHLLHQLNIVHLDIKPENLGLSPRNNSLILIDFGLSKIIAEQIGTPSVSSFVGSMNFCSEEMLELFLKDRPGVVDLYLNDAIALDKTKLKIFEQFSECKLTLQEQEYRYSNILSISQRSQWHQFLNYCIKHQIKAQLFDLACNTICQTSILSQFSEITRRYQHQFRTFVSSLPQTFRLIYYYKTHLRTHLSIDDPEVFLSDSTIRKQAIIDQAPILFVQRFRILKCINRNEGYEPQQSSMGIPIEEVIFDRERIIQIKKSTYLIMLARFIRINSYHLNFEAKVTACKIYNEIFMKLQGVFSATELYKLTVKSLFESAVASLDQPALEILINLIETTVILEVVPEGTYSEAYTTILGANIELSQKMTVIIEFITSLEFTREKFKRKYSYDHLLVSFLLQLNQFVDFRLSLPSSAKDEERLLFSVLKRLIARRAQVRTSGCASFRELMLFFDPQRVILGNRKLHDTIGSYISFAIISDQLSEYHTGKQRLIQEIMMWMRRKRFRRNVFSYIHLVIYKATEKTYQERDNEYVYRLFYTQLHTFQEHRHFNIYLFHLINTVKRSFSKEHIRSKYQIHQKDKLICDYSSITENLEIYDEIFAILDDLIKNSNNFHPYLDHLLVKPPAIYSSQVCKRYLKRLLQCHPQKILTLSRPIVGQHHYHYTDLKYEIFVVSHIFQYMCNLLEIPIEEWRVILRKFMQQCQSAVAITDCIECKIHGLLFVNQIYSNYIYIQGEIEESFLVIVESMILQMKNQRYYQNLMEFMVPTIRRWCKLPTIYKKYNLEGFLYDYIKLTGSHDYCLIDIKDYSILPHLYLYIVRFLSQTDLVDFMFAVTQKLAILKSIEAVDNFYYAILFIIADSKRLGSLANFKMYHDGIVQDILRRIDVEKGPYMALYFYALLDIRLRTGIEPRMLKKISISLKYIDSYSRKIIFNNYFEYLAIYSQIPYKKKYNVCRQHLKLSSQLFNFKFVVNMKIGPKVQEQKDKVKMRIFKKCVKRYHKNIANIP